jgi:serine phosphatase RsbU (regulator of sigma subunit)
MPGSVYEARGVALGRGDLLAIYTDGLSETMDEAEHELGHEAIERCLVRLASAPLSEIQRAVFEVVARHGVQTDDRTLLLVRIK